MTMQDPTQTLVTLPIVLDRAAAALGRAWGAVRWWFRKWFWVGLGCFKAAMNKPLVIPMPPSHPQPITLVPMAQAIPQLPLQQVLACPPAQIPPEERSASKTGFYRLQVWLYRAYPPMQPGLPSASADPDRMMAEACTWLHRRFLGVPALPAEYLAAPELGALAVRGPYAVYTRRAAEGGFEWDLRGLQAFEHHAGLRRLGARVHFELLPAQRTLRATAIDCSAGRFTPADAGWGLARDLALCSATTHLSLVRHFNHVHLAAGAPLAAATRNHLPQEHPLLRLLWPCVFATQQSNDTVTRGQMLPGGDFECTFSFSFDGLCRLFDASWTQHDFGVNDPAADASARGVIGQGFDTPAEDQLARLFELMHLHARRYLALYYPHAAAGGEVSLAGDPALGDWLDELNRTVPGGVGLTRGTLGFDGLARLVARCLYLVTVQHELLGSFLWNWQNWVHRQPVRVYASGQRAPLDVVQRLLNANFNLNVHRRALEDDFSYLALDAQGAAEMQRFVRELQALQDTMEREPWAAWKLYPRTLKVNINA